MKKILMLLIMGIFLISMVSATDWDNKLEYSEDELTVNFSNTFLKLFETSQIGSAELKSHKNVNEIRGLSIGDDKIAMIYEFNFKEIYEEGFGDVKIINMRTGKEELKDYYFAEIIFKEVDNYKGVCNFVDKKEICEEVRDGTKIKEIIGERININNIPKGVTTIGLIVDVERGDYYDAVWTIVGKEVEKHALWDASGTYDTSSFSTWLFGVDNDGTYIYSADLSEDIVKVMWMNGTFYNSYTANTALKGLAVYGDYLYTSDEAVNNIYKSHKSNGTAISNFASDTSVTPRGMCADSTGLYLTDDGQDKIYKMTFAGATITNWALSGTNMGGCHSNETFIWVLDVGNTEVDQHFANGTYMNNDFNMLGGNANSYGITCDTGAYCYLTDGTDDLIYLYEAWGLPSPTVTLISPTDASTTSNPSITFSGTITVATPLNVSLIIDDVYNETNSSGDLGEYNFTKILSEGVHTWNYESCSSVGCGNGTARTITVDTTPFIQFETPTPVDQFNTSTNPYLPVNVTLTETYYQNISFDFYNNGAVTTYDYTDGTRYINNSFVEGEWEYNVTTWTTTGQSNTTETRTWNYDATSPVISGTGNLTDLNVFTLPTNSSWNFTASDDHLSTCWYSNDSGVTNNTVTCNSYINTTWTTQGNKTLNYCANDTFGFETCATSYIWVYLLSYDQEDTPDPIVEGFDATFNLTVNRTNIPVTTANLILNNTVYTPTVTAGTNGYFFEVEVTIPDGWGNTTGITQDWLWNYSITGITSGNTSTTNITVYELAMDDCSSYGEVILDLSLKDEESGSVLNGSLGGQVEIDLRLTSKDDATFYLDFNETWNNETNPQVCLPLNVLNNSQYWIDFTIGFDYTDRVWEFYYLDDGTLNLTKEFNPYTDYKIDLMDLLTTDSTSFLFNYFDKDGLAVDDAIVHAYRRYIGSGEFLEVERSKADQNGDTIVHLVEEDVIYYFVITQYGEILFTSSQYTALCQDTPCTIQIEASGDGATFGTDWDLLDNGAYVLSSNADTRQVNLTYSFNTTSTVNLTVYKYENDGSYTAIDTASSTGTTETMLITVPQSAGNVSFFASVIVDDEFINSEWVDFEQKSSDFFGTTLALFLGALLILTLGLMAVTEGVGTIVMVILGVVIASALGLLTTELSTGVNVIVYLVVAGGIILWKLTGGRK